MTISNSIADQALTTTSSPSFTATTSGNINLATNNIITTNTNGDLNLIPNGSGNIKIGNSTWTPNALLNIAHDNRNAQIAYGTFENSASGPTTYYFKSRSTTIGSFSAVNNNDILGQSAFYGDDGAAFNEAAVIKVSATAGIASGIIPAKLEIFTTNTVGVTTLALTINSSQVVTLANALPVQSGGTGLNSTTINQLLYSSGANTIAGLATANNGLLVTSAGGIPSIGNTIGASISVTGSITGTTGFTSGIANSSSGITTYLTDNGAGTAPGSVYKIAKSSTSSTPAIFLQITVPAGNYFIGIECFIINSRAAVAGNIGTSFVQKKYFSIARNGSGSDVVLDSLAGADFVSTTTTAGGAQNAISGATTIVRNGAEPNTDPQVVNITINPQTTSASAGCYTIFSTINVLGSAVGLVIA